MITKSNKILLDVFVKRVNRKLDYFASQKIELTWYAQGNDLYVCDLKHYSKTFEEIGNHSDIVFYAVGLGVGLNEDLGMIWQELKRFQDIVDGNL